MPTQRIVGFVLVLLGVILLVMGLAAMDSFRSQVSKFFTGSPSDRAVWLTIGGAVAILAGSVAAMIPARAARA